MTTQLHDDLITHLRNKLKHSIVDYVDLAKTMDVESSAILAGAADALLTITVSFCHTSLNMDSHDFATFCFKLYKHFEEQEKAASQPKRGG